MSESDKPDDALISNSAKAADDVDAQVERLRVAGQGGEPSKVQAGVQMESAILAALVARRETEDHILIARNVLTRLDTLDVRLNTVSETVAASVERFGQLTDATSRKLTFWTKVMAIATGALVLTALAQIYAMIAFRP